MGNMLREKLYSILGGYSDEIIEMRRYLHKYPELSFKEFNTAGYILDFYEKHKKNGVEVKYPVGKNGISVKIKGGAADKNKKTLALRGDFDALGIQEQTDLPFGSVTPGVMHACGHDAHTAILLAAAAALIEVSEELPGDAVIIHQYAEEVPPGGAADMIRDGVLEGADAVIGGHVWASYDFGEAAVSSGMIMAGRACFKAVIKGRGGHGSQPHLCADPILAASHFVTAAQSIVSRNIDPLESAVVSFGRFEGLGTFNAIPEIVSLEGDVRSFSEKTGKFIERRFKEILAGICEAYSCSFELSYTHDYPPVNNDEKLAELAKSFINSGGVPDLALRAGNPTTGSEDFSYYQGKIPGLYVFFGAKPNGEAYPHHHPKFDIDERCLIGCAKFYAGFTALFLEQK